MNIYKIKVGIEEYSIEEKDIPRIVEAMKNNDMVQLNCGVFRGNAILAVARDTKKELEASLLEASKPTPEQIEERKKLNEEKERLNTVKEKIKKQISECDLCNHTGRRMIDRKLPNGSPDPFVIDCECVKIK